jgi:hypothetical protein
MNEQDKLWIDNASYEDLLRIWRYAPLGDGVICSRAKLVSILVKLCSQRR